MVVAWTRPPAPRPALDREQGQGEDDEGERKLRSAGRAVHVEPHVEDPGRERWNREEIDGAELVEGLHEGEGGSDRDAGPRHRQGDREEAPHRPAAEGTARLEQAEALLDEGGPGEQVDVGVEHERQHDRRPAEGADLGKPVVAGGGPAERFAKRGLDRTRVLELVGDDEGEDVARHRERQQERPGEDPPPGKAVHGHEPGGAGPDDDGAGPHPQQEPQGVRDVDGEDGRREVAPGVVRGVDRPVRDGGEGHRDEGGDGGGGDRPAVEGRLRGAADGGREDGHVIRAPDRRAPDRKDPRSRPAPRERRGGTPRGGATARGARFVRG